MFKIICITNRTLAADFLRQIRKIAEARPDLVIVREKDLVREKDFSEAEYEARAAEVLQICRENGVKCVFHTFADAAKKQKADGIHLTLPDLRNLQPLDKSGLTEIGCSVHSSDEAAEAQALGAVYIAAGHVFQTDCKKDLPPRGLKWLSQVCESVSIPVYALGGINAANAKQCVLAGAAGVCMMSEFMQTPSPEALIRSLRGGRLFPSEENGRDIAFDELKNFDQNDYTIVDIRGNIPFKLGNIAGSINVPFPQEAARIYEIPREKPVLVCCQKGDISREVTEILTDAGYEAYNLAQGYLGWMLTQMGGV